MGLLLLLGGSLCQAKPDPRWRIHDRNQPQPAVVDPGTPSTQEDPGRPPSDAVILFDGSDLAAWSAMNGEKTKSPHMP